MKYCKNCGKEMKDGAVFCSECGTEESSEKQETTKEKNPYVAKPHDKKRKRILTIVIVAAIAVLVLIVVRNNIVAYNEAGENVNENYAESIDSLSEDYSLGLTLSEYVTNYNQAYGQDILSIDKMQSVKSLYGQYQVPMETPDGKELHVVGCGFDRPSDAPGWTTINEDYYYFIVDDDGYIYASKEVIRLYGQETLDYYETSEGFTSYSVLLSVMYLNGFTSDVAESAEICDNFSTSLTFADGNFEYNYGATASPDIMRGSTLEISVTSVRFEETEAYNNRNEKAAETSSSETTPSEPSTMASLENISIGISLNDFSYNSDADIENVFSQNYMNTEHYVEVYDGAPGNQLSSLEHFVTMGVDAIIYVPADADMSNTIQSWCAEAGIVCLEISEQTPIEEALAKLATMISSDSTGKGDDPSSSSTTAQNTTPFEGVWMDEQSEGGEVSIYYFTGTEAYFFIFEYSPEDSTFFLNRGDGPYPLNQDDNGIYWIEGDGWEDPPSISWEGDNRISIGYDDYYGSYWVKDNDPNILEQIEAALLKNS